MKNLFKAIGLLAATVLLTAGLLWLDPFALVSAVLDAAFGAAPTWTQVSNLAEDPRIQEVSHGDHPLGALKQLENYWQTKPGAPKVVLIGNSQMLEMSLAPDERPTAIAEHTYPDLVASHFAEHGVLTYRLAAPGMSYSEALWYLDYLRVHPALRPSALVLQVNYQAFWNGAIRDSLLEMLADPSFRAQIDAEAQSSEPNAIDFQNALKQFDERQAHASTPAVAHGFGARLEDIVRAPLQSSAFERRRAHVKQSFEQMLYRGRLYVLHVKPSNARSIAGPRLTRSQASLQAIARASAEANIRLVLFTAPLNPRVSLYASSEDRQRFQQFLDGFVAKYDLHLFDLERSVDADLWGRQFNSPDPLHMGRKAHRLVADRMVKIVDAVLYSKG